jgi:hypothetical protein
MGTLFLIRNEELRINSWVLLSIESPNKRFVVFGKSTIGTIIPIMNTCCNEWRNWRFFESVNESKKKKIGTYFL